MYRSDIPLPRSGGFASRIDPLYDRARPHLPLGELVELRLSADEKRAVGRRERRERLLPQVEFPEDVLGTARLDESALSLLAGQVDVAVRVDRRGRVVAPELVLPDDLAGLRVDARVLTAVRHYVQLVADE